MIRSLSVLVVMALVGCVPTSEEAFAPMAKFNLEIEMCRDRNACDQLCVRVFEVAPQDIAACRITRMVPDGAYVRIDYYSDDSGFGFDFDDGGDYPDDGGDYEPTPDDAPLPDEDNEPDDDPEPDDEDGYDGDEEP